MGTRLIGRFCATLAVGGLLSCSGPTALVERQVTATTTEREATQFRMAQRRAAWSAQAGTMALIRRVIPGEQQQIIGLENETATKGDNFLYMVAYGKPESMPKSPKLETVLERVGGVPEPFTTFTDSDLNEQRDALGTYLWKEQKQGDDVTCVLAFRRLGIRSRILPAGSGAMEVVLRNCVNGDATAAIAPMRADRLAFAADAAVVNGTVHPRALNPLAAPGR